MKQYVADAFTDQVFKGNPAAICVVEQYPAEEMMLKITRENNLSETAFLVPEGEGYHLRWFTPGGEIDLCGHATLASGFVILNYYRPQLSSVQFQTLSGTLTVTREENRYRMDFPAYSLRPVAVTDAMEAALGVRPLEAWMGRDLLCVLEDEAQVRNLKPDMEKVLQLEGLLLHVTARGKNYDCVSRSFVPKMGIAEDPVCGSGHCHIFPYWANKLKKDELTGYQASARGGVVYGHLMGERIALSGQAALYAVAELQLEL